jgi:hypothetical protein
MARASEPRRGINPDVVQRKINAGEPVSSEEREALQQFNQGKLNEVQRTREAVSNNPDKWGTNNDVRFKPGSTGMEKLQTLREKLGSIMSIFPSSGRPANPVDMAAKYLSAQETAGYVKSSAQGVAAEHLEVIGPAFQLSSQSAMIEASMARNAMEQFARAEADLLAEKKQNELIRPGGTA